MAEWFQSRGWDVSVWTGMPHYPEWQVRPAYRDLDYRRGEGDEIVNGVRVMRVGHYVPDLPLTGGKRVRLDASYLAAWSWRLRRLPERPDCLLAVAPPFLTGLLGRVIGTWLGIPVAYHIQDLQIDAAERLGLLPGTLLGPLKLAERLSLERADRLSACGKAMARRIEARLHRPRYCHHDPNWADLDLVQPEAGPNRYRELFNIPVGRCVVMYSGNLGSKQGLDSVTECIREMPDEGLEFLIAGAGADARRLADALGGCQHVHLIDLQPRSLLSHFLAAGDIHLVPQHPAASDLVLPSKVGNIMAAGRPLLATAHPKTELADLVQRAGAGIVVEPCSAEALATGIRRLRDDPGLRQRAGMRGRAYAERHLSKDRLLRKVEAQLLRLVQGLGRQRWTASAGDP